MSTLDEDFKSYDFAFVFLHKQEEDLETEQVAWMSMRIGLKTLGAIYSR